jgi:hypothetical protein
MIIVRESRCRLVIFVSHCIVCLRIRCVQPHPLTRSSDIVSLVLVGQHDAAGTDIKSIVLNVSTTAFFLLPIVCYIIAKLMDFDEGKKSLCYSIAIGTTIVLYALAYITPPFGWRRPHPYSDDPTNVPCSFRTKQN